MMQHKNSRRGFTLIELLVVVLIIGILAAVAVPQYHKAVLKSKYASIKALSIALAQAEERYYLEYGKYTLEISELDISFTESPIRITLIQRGNKGYYFVWGLCNLVNHDLDDVPRVSCKLQMDADNQISYMIHLSQHTKSKHIGPMCVASKRNNTTGKQFCMKETARTKENEIVVQDWYYYYY